MSKSVLGMFDHIEGAEAAIRELTANGFDRESISLIGNANRDERADEIVADEAAADGAAVGATSGAVVGGLAGFVLGLGLIAVPGIGPLLAGGPFIAALTGAAVGAGFGGIVGGLTNAGIPEEDARIYAEGIRRGASLVIVHAADAQSWNAVDVFRRHGAIDIEQRREEVTASPASAPLPLPPAQAFAGREPAIASSAVLERPAASSRISPAVEPVVENEEEWDFDCRRHYTTNLSDSGRTYDEMRPAYEYGYHAASDPRFKGHGWTETEANVRQDWSTRGQGSWEEVKDAVRCGWGCGRRSERTSATPSFAGVTDSREPIERDEEAVTGDQFDLKSGTRI